MSACRIEPLAPLVDFLSGLQNGVIADIMLDVMPIVRVPKLSQKKMIDQLIDYVRSSGMLVEVCNSAAKFLTKEYLHMILRQYDPKANQKRPKREMIEQFVKLMNIKEGDENLCDDGQADGPCLAIVPCSDADFPACGARWADFPAQVVDYESCGRQMRKTKRKLIKKWFKGARLLRRKFLSKAIVKELKRCLDDGLLMQWTVATLRDHVSSVVDKPLHSGHARVFFNKKVQEVLISKRMKPRSRKKPKVVLMSEFAVPKKKFTMIADDAQWREMSAMRAQDMRT